MSPRTERSSSSGFALLQLALATSLAVLAGAALELRSSDAAGPSQLIAANERAAIAALRSIADAQARFVALVAIDSDMDGVGEYGYLGELAGTAPLRIWSPAGPVLHPYGQTLEPALLSGSFASPLLNALGESVVVQDGYVFRVWLPSPTYPTSHVRGIPETGANGVGGATPGFFPDPDNGERFWAAYAWPLENGVTGRRAFFLDQQGQLLHTPNRARQGRPGRTYEGTAGGPWFDAAYSDRPAMPGGLEGMGAPPGNPPRRANDGNRWTPLGS